MVSPFLVVFMPNVPLAPQGVEDLLPETHLSPSEEHSLMASLEGGSPSVVSSAMRKLGDRLRHRLQSVIRRLKDPSPIVRSAAVEVIGTLRIKSLAHRLYAMMLHDPSPLVRGQAAQSLGELGYTKARQAVLDMLDRPDIREQLGAINALGHLGGPRVLRALAGKLQSPSPEVREAAVYALGELGQRRAMRYLIRMLGSAEPSVKAAAVRTLARMGYRRLVSRLPDYLKAGDTRIVEAALDAAVALRCTTAGCSRSLAELAHSKDPMTAANAILTGAYLNVLSREQAAQAVKTGLPPEAQRRILYGLARLGSEKALAFRALDSKLPELRTAGLYAIRLLRPKKTGRPLADIIAEGLKDPHPDVRAQAVMAAVEMELLADMPSLPDGPDFMPVWAEAVTVRGMKQDLKKAFMHMNLAAQSTWSLFRAAALMAPSLGEKEAVRYLALGRDPRGTAWASLVLALTGKGAYRRLLRDAAIRRGNEIPELFVAAAVGDALTMKSPLYRLLVQKVQHSGNRRTAMFAAAALWRAAPVSGEGPFTRAFDSYFMKGINSSQKAWDFNFLSAAFASSFTPWVNRAASSRVYMVVWRSMVWSHTFRQISPVKIPTEPKVTQLPEPELPKPRLRLPFKVDETGEKSGCGCSSVPASPDLSVVISFILVVAMLRRRHGRIRA